MDTHLWFDKILDAKNIFKQSVIFACFSEDGGDPPKEEEEKESAKRKQFKSEKQKSREFEVEGDILKPEFMATKSMVDYAPAEISAVEQYEASLGKCSTHHLTRFFWRQEISSNDRIFFLYF